MKKIILITVCLITLIFQSGCKKDFLDTKPSQAVSGEVLLNTIDGAEILLTGTNRYRFVWTGVNPHQYYCGEKSMDLELDALGTDFYNTFNADYWNDWGTVRELHHTMDNSIQAAAPWVYCYRMIDNVNQLIDGFDKIQDGTQPQRDYWKAQALLYRGYYYHRLIQIYAKPYHTDSTALGVPLNLTATSEPAPRNTVREVYQQILTDLLEAETLLTGNTTVPRRNKSMADINVVRGVLARVFASMHLWTELESYASQAKVGYPLMTKAQYRSGFCKENSEWMWATIAPADEHQNAPNFFNFMTNGSGYPGAWGYENCINRELYLHADPTDCRFYGTSANGNSMVKYYKVSGYPAAWNEQAIYNKFHLVGMNAFDIVYMRSAEMILLEAEAKLMRATPDYAGARVLLQTLMDARSDNYDATSIANADLLAEIKIQRRMEFWGEGLAFYDLKRWGEGLNRANNGQHTSLNGRSTIPANDSYWVFLIPKSETDANGHIVQN